MYQIFFCGGGGGGQVNVVKVVSSTERFLCENGRRSLLNNRRGRSKEALADNSSIILGSIFRCLRRDKNCLFGLSSFVRFGS